MWTGEAGRLTVQDGMADRSLWMIVLEAIAGIVGRRRRHETLEAAAERRARERRRERRFRTQPTARLRLRVAEHDYDIYDLSIRGLCLLMPPSAPPLVQGTEVHGTIALDRGEVELRLAITNVRRPFVGCRVLEPDKTWIDEVTRVIDPLRIGAELREIDPRWIKQDDSGLAVRYFQSGSVCELQVWSDADGGIVKAQMFFRLHAVEWSRQHGLRTGELEEQAHVERRINPTAQLYSLRAPPDDEILRFARDILTASPVPPAVRVVMGCAT